MDENCIFCLIFSIVLIVAAVSCLICMYKLAEIEKFFLKLCRKSFLKKMSRLGFTSLESIELFEFFYYNCQPTITNRQLRLLLRRLKEDYKNNEELSYEKEND